MKLFKKFALAVVCTTLAVFTFSACGEDNEGTSVTGVSLDKSELTVNIGESKTLKATVAPAEADNKAVKWSTSDETIASVTGGVVKGLSEGTVTITVTTEEGNFTDDCEVTVEKPDGPYFAVSPELNYLIFSVDGETAKDNEGNEVSPVFTVNTSQEWDITIDPEVEWLTVEETEDSFTIVVAENTDRTTVDKVTVTVTPEGINTFFAIEVEQEAATPEVPTTLEVDPEITAVLFSSTGKTAYNGEETIDPVFTVTTDAETWDATSSEEWCTVTKDGDTFTLSVSANLSEEETREATVTVTANEAEFEITVSQKVREANVYVAGAMATNIDAVSYILPTYWKDGEYTQIGTRAGVVTSIIVDDNGVIHMVGYSARATSTYATPKYWVKEGDSAIVETELNYNGLARACQATDMYIKDGVVYISGYLTESYLEGSTTRYVAVPVYWRDGEITKLEDIGSHNSGQATSIFVDEEDVVWIGGYTALISAGVVQETSLTYWRNNTLVVAEDNMASTDNKINGLYGYDGEMHMIGTGKNIADAFLSALSWTGGTKNVLLSGIDEGKNIYGQSIFVNEDGIYACGYSSVIIPFSSVHTPYYWINGARHELTTAAPSTEPSHIAGMGKANAITVSEGIIYIAGTYQHRFFNSGPGSYDYTDIPCYWIDGEEQTLNGMYLDRTGYTARDIFVVVHE